MIARTTNPGSAIRAFTGGVFDPLNPDPERIQIEDIAHALSRQNRFLGHPDRSYSVAEHSLHVSRACEPEDALWGLLHDAPETFLGDWPSPLKYSPLGEAYRDAEATLMEAVCVRFGLDPEMPASVSRADKAMLERERKLVFSRSSDEAEGFWAAWRVALPEMDDSELPAYCTPQWWSPELTEQLFIERFRELGGR